MGIKDVYQSFMTLIENTDEYYKTSMKEACRNWNGDEAHLTEIKHMDDDWNRYKEGMLAVLGALEAECPEILDEQ